MTYKKFILPKLKKKAKVLLFFETILLERLDEVRKELADYEEDNRYSDKEKLKKLQEREEDLLIKLHKILND